MKFAKSGDETVAVTGGGGFFGAAVCRKLCELGFTVKALDSFPKGIPTRLRTLSDQFREQLTILHSDITTKENLGLELRDSNYVVHLAAIANPRVCNSNLELAYKVNIEGLRNVLDSAPKVKKILFTSSILVYGEQAEIPVRETAKPNCVDNYGLLKLMGEHLCKIYNNSRGLPYVVVRMAYAFGEWQSFDYIISTLILQALKERRMEIWDPRPVRDFIYVDDAVNALVAALLSDKVLCETVNVGSGAGTSVLELADLLSQLLSVPVEDINRRQQTPIRFVADVTKIRTLTGWKPAIELKEGLAKTVAWMRLNVPKQ